MIAIKLHTTRYNTIQHNKTRWPNECNISYDIKVVRCCMKCCTCLAGALPISASLAVVSTVSTFVGVILLLSSKKYKRKLLKCYELLDKITSSLATFEVLISLSLDNGTVIDAKEFHKLQTLYLQLMTYVRNIDRKMKVETEENFQKTVKNEINNLRNALE